jgi:2-keto-3-deoxy-L-rhamnonate aldolase RhmA
MIDFERKRVMRPNPVKTQLAQGGRVFGTMVFEFATPGLPSILAQGGADYALYCMEHTGFTVADMKRQFQYCRAAGIMPIVRPPDKSYTTTALLLDIGAMGFMFQMVGSAREAREIVSWTKYPPQGRRGAMFGGAHDDYAGGDLAQKMRAANDRTLVMMMIETREGLENMEEIIATPGVDGVHLGQFDLSLSLGIPGQFDQPVIQNGIDRMLKACRKHGKFAACMAPTLDTAREWMVRGFRMVSYSYDIGLMADRLREGLSALRAQEASSARAHKPAEASQLRGSAKAGKAAKGVKADQADKSAKSAKAAKAAQTGKRSRS